MSRRFLSNVIVLIIACAPIACSSNSHRKEQVKENHQPLDSSNRGTAETPRQSKDTLGKSFDNKKPFEIVSLVKGISSASTDDDSAKCIKWTISKTDLQKIVRNSQPISGTELDLAYENLRCIITAKLLQNGQNFELELNAGSWMYLRCRDTTLILGDDTKSDRRHFLSHASNE